MNRSLVRPRELSRLCHHLDVPRLVADPKRVAFRITDVNVTRLNQLAVDIRACEGIGEVFGAESNLAHIEVADSVIGVPRRCKGTGSS